MTCREKLMAEHPNEYEKVFTKHGVTACPAHYSYMPKPDDCDYSVFRDIGGTRCHDCWNREIGNTNKKSTPIAKVVDVKEENGGLTVTMEPVIKDSGDRTQFKSGAVRDMREGKGRCDLMPLEVVNKIFAKGREYDEILFDLAEFMKHKRDTDWLVLALNNFAKKNYDDSYPTMFLECAKHFEEGAKKYGENNWQKGIPTYCYIDSAIRHYLKWLRGDKDEPHDRAFVWNLMCCIWEVDYHKENK